VSLLVESMGKKTIIAQDKSKFVKGAFEGLRGKALPPGGRKITGMSTNSWNSITATRGEKRC